MLPHADRIRYDEAAADLRQHYEATGTRGLEEADYRLAHLKAFFTGRRLASIEPADAAAYVAKRQAAAVSNGTINRELAVLNRMLRLAYENGKLLWLPVIRKLKEAAPCEGFFEREAFLAVRRKLSEDLQVAVTIAYTYGWRMQSEVLSLDRRQLDLAAGTLRLDPGTTKNDDGRLRVPHPRGEGAPERPARARGGPAEATRPDHPVPVPVSSRPPAGRGATEGLPEGLGDGAHGRGNAGMLRHDFRCTAVRNMVNAGVPERVAMKVTGTARAPCSIATTS
jgi:integrase